MLGAGVLELVPCPVIPYGRQPSTCTRATCTGARHLSCDVPQGPMLVLVQAGEGEARASGANITVLEAEPRLRTGDVFFVPVGTSLELAAGAGAPLTLWVAAVNAQAGSSLSYAMSLFDVCVAVCVCTPDIMACLIDSPLFSAFCWSGRSRQVWQRPTHRHGPPSMSPL